jgi:predicted nuclease of predicted toxin-antitoxin system
LRQVEQDVVICRALCGADPSDDQILAHASRSGQVLVTLDKDFGELQVALGAAHAEIVRLVDFRYLEQAPVCARIRHDLPNSSRA